MINMRRKAFTITELSIAMLIMTTMAAAVALSTNAAKQTAKNEADRIAIVLRRLIETADRMHSVFWFIPEDNNIYVVRKKTYSAGAREKLDFKVSGGCSFSSPDSQKGLGYNTDARANYAVISTALTPAVRVEVSSETKSDEKIKFTVTVKGADNSTCYVYVFAEGD